MGAKKTLAKTDYVVVECNEFKAEILELLSGRICCRETEVYYLCAWMPTKKRSPGQMQA